MPNAITLPPYAVNTAVVHRQRVRPNKRGVNAYGPFTESPPHASSKAHCQLERLPRADFGSSPGGRSATSAATAVSADQKSRSLLRHQCSLHQRNRRSDIPHYGFCGNAQHTITCAAEIPVFASIGCGAA